MTITIGISEDVWKVLIQRKQPGESFDSVLRKVLNLKIKKEKKK